MSSTSSRILLVFLLQHDCRYFQGYLFGRPEPLEAFAQRILAQAAASFSITA